MSTTTPEITPAMRHMIVEANIATMIMDRFACGPKEIRVGHETACEHKKERTAVYMWWANEGYDKKHTYHFAYCEQCRIAWWQGAAKRVHILAHLNSPHTSSSYTVPTARS